MNTIDATGLHLRTRAEIIDQIVNGGDGFPGLVQIYGSDINVDPNSPDGQLVNLLAQLGVDYEDLVAAVYASFDPDQAEGINLDLRVAINGINRQAGTYSTQLAAVTVTQALTIAGLDTAPTAPFTISDSAGNQFQLLATHVFGGAGSANLNFQAAQLGAIQVQPNTLTTIVTVQLGVASVTNGSLSGTTGTNEESDYQLRIRRSNSTALGSKGFLAGLYGAIGNTSGVTAVSIQENIPAHTIWCVVAGGTDADVANAINVKRNAGVAMLGAVIVPVTEVDGTVLDVRFDRPTAQNLWIELDVIAVTGFVDPVAIRSAILAAPPYAIGGSAAASPIIALVQALYPNASISSVGVSNDGVTYVDLLSPLGFNYQFATAAARVLINGIPG